MTRGGAATEGKPSVNYSRVKHGPAEFETADKSSKLSYAMAVATILADVVLKPL